MMRNPSARAQEADLKRHLFYETSHSPSRVEGEDIQPSHFKANRANYKYHEQVHPLTQAVLTYAKS